MITIELGWPVQCLWPNRSGGQHWAVSSEARAIARDEGRVLTMQALTAEHPTGAAMRLTFHAPTNRRYDLQNALSALKPHLDGIADALHVDDCTFSPITIVRGAVRKPGCVTVEIDVA